MYGLLNFCFIYWSRFLFPIFVKLKHYTKYHKPQLKLNFENMFQNISKNIPARTHFYEGTSKIRWLISLYHFRSVTCPSFLLSIVGLFFTYSNSQCILQSILTKLENLSDGESWLFRTWKEMLYEYFIKSLFRNLKRWASQKHFSLFF